MEKREDESEWRRGGIGLMEEMEIEGKWGKRAVPFTVSKLANYLPSAHFLLRP